MVVRRALPVALMAFVWLIGGALLPARLHWPLGPSIASAQPDCDNDGDGDQDENEYGECYEPPPLPQHPFTDDQKQLYRDLIWQAWNTCTASGHPLPPPVELPGPVIPGQTQLPSQLLQTYYSILSSQFGSMCGDLGALGVYGASMLSVDPPDPNSAVVALPRPQGARRRSPSQCLHLAPHFRAACRAFAANAFGYADLITRATSLTEAMAVAGNRYANEKLATANFNSATAASMAANAQLVAEHAYAGELAASINALHSTGVKLAKALIQVRLDVRFTNRQARAMRRALRTLRGFPSGFVASLRRDALDPTAIKAMLAQRLAQAKVKAFYLTALLRQPTATTALMAAYNSTTLSQLADLVGELTAQSVVSKQANIALNDDLQNAQVASDPAQRRSAMKQFVADSKRLVAGPYSKLLEVAAQPLAS